MRGEYSLADIAAATGNGGNNGSNGAFGDGFGSWWIIVFLIFAFWGRGGWNNDNGSNGSNGGDSVMDAYVLNSDFATLQRLMESGFDRIGTGINQVNNGICNLGYSTLENFNTTNMNVATGFANLNNALCNQSFQIERGITGLGTQLQGCCCDIESGIQGVNYNMAMNTNAIQQTLCNNTRDIIENTNQNYRQLHDEIVANRISDKDAQITAQQNEINALRLASSQAQQNEYLLNQLRTGCPVNAQLVCGNTPIPVQYIGAGCGCNNGCGSYNY